MHIIRQAFDFALWASQREHLPTIEDIRTRMACSRATAYRWRDEWLGANGIRHVKREPCRTFRTRVPAAPIATAYPPLPAATGSTHAALISRI
jgi:hypothetical protein